MHTAAGIQPGAREGFIGQPGLRRRQRIEINRQQAADHGLAILGHQRTGKGDLLGLLRQIGLVFWPDAQAQFGTVRFIDEMKDVDHLAAPLLAAGSGFRTKS